MSLKGLGISYGVHVNQRYVMKTHTIIFRIFGKDENKSLSENETMFTGVQIKHLPLSISLQNNRFPIQQLHLTYINETWKI